MTCALLMGLYRDEELTAGPVTHAMVMWKAEADVGIGNEDVGPVKHQVPP
jgi:hypothetical protein